MRNFMHAGHFCIVSGGTVVPVVAFSLLLLKLGNVSKSILA